MRDFQALIQKRAITATMDNLERPPNAPPTNSAPQPHSSLRSGQDLPPQSRPRQGNDTNTQNAEQQNQPEHSVSKSIPPGIFSSAQTRCLTGLFTHFLEEMQGQLGRMLDEKLQQNQPPRPNTGTRNSSPVQYQRRPAPGLEYTMSGAQDSSPNELTMRNEKGNSRYPHQRLEGMPLPQHNDNYLGSNTSTPIMKTRRARYTPYRQGEYQHWPPRLRQSYPNLNYAPMPRALTPKEQRIQEDNERVKAMGGSIKFQPDIIGYFYPDMSQVEHRKNTVEIGGKTHYRNVRDFIDAADRAILTHAMPEHVIRNSLNMCFKGTATLWFQTELNTTTKMRVLEGEGINNWARELIEKYHELPAVALKKLLKNTYTSADLLNNHSPAEWAIGIMRLCQDAEMDGGEHQFTAQAWNQLDPQLQVHIPMPDRKTTLSTFIQTLEKKFPVIREVLKTQGALGKSTFRPLRDSQIVRSRGFQNQDTSYSNRPLNRDPNTNVPGGTQRQPNHNNFPYRHPNLTV